MTFPVGSISAGFKCITRFLKFTPPIKRPIGGMMMSLTNEETILPKAPPIIIPTAISTTLPFMAKALNSFKKLIALIL